MNDQADAGPILVRTFYSATPLTQSTSDHRCNQEGVFRTKSTPTPTLEDSTIATIEVPDGVTNPAYGLTPCANYEPNGATPLLTQEKLCAGSVERNLNVTAGQTEEPLVFPKVVAWDWPFTSDGAARGVYEEDKFSIHLPFSGGSDTQLRTMMKKFSKISESNFCWTIGLSSWSSSAEGGSGFWRMELEIVRNLNCLVLLISRDISRAEKQSKKLKLVRKVYRLPNYYDVSTLTSTSNDWSILIEVRKREEARPRGKCYRIRRHNTATE